MSNLDVVQAPGTTTVPEPRKDEAVVFAAFFNTGLWIPSVDLVAEVLRLYGVELAQLTPNSLVRLSIFEWALRSSAVEVSAKLFAYFHDAGANQSEGRVPTSLLILVVSTSRQGSEVEVSAGRRVSE